MCVSVCVRVCARVCVCAYMRVYACVCVCVWLVSDLHVSPDLDNVVAMLSEPLIDCGDPSLTPTLVVTDKVITVLVQ